MIVTRRRVPVSWITCLTISWVLAALCMFGQSGPAGGAFERLMFREIGPATPSGRIDDFAVYEKNPSIFYIGSATGGLWKTVNEGTTFEPVFDDEGSSSIGAVAIAPNDPNLVWVGTGEANNRQSSSWGDGVYKSSDGGKTWKNMGLKESRQIARVIVDPLDNDTVYVAAMGSLWGPGGERGVFKTTDGGVTWTKVLSAGEYTGATDLVMDPRNRKVLYAALYQRLRATWGYNGGGPESAIYKTTDGGKAWTRLTRGIPEGPLGRIGLDIYRKDPNIVYALIQHATQSGVYRSENSGASWTELSDLNPRPSYFSQIRIDPNDIHRIYVAGVMLFISDDGGKTFRSDGARKLHVDFHAIWIDPNNSNHILVGEDGGAGISYDRSKTYVWFNNLPLGQFYHVSYDMRSPYYVVGGLQDNNSWYGPSAVRSVAGISNDDWRTVTGGDGFVALIDPNDSRTMYVENEGGRVIRVDVPTNERKSIRPEAAEGEQPYRWNWNSPIAISPHNSSTIFVAANRVFKSTDRGQSIRPISPDLTGKADRDTLELMGIKGKEPMLSKNDGVNSFSTLVTFAESPKKAGLYYAGSDDGVVHVSRDDGANWTDITANIPGLPARTYVAQLVPSRFQEATVYAAFDGHRLNDFGTYAYVSADTGKTWKSITGDLPKGEVVRTIAEDLKNPNVLYLGSERGLFVTLDGGKHWQRVKANLPTVPIYEITLHPRDNAMLLATHGRSIWILDDLTPFQQFSQAQASDAYLMQARSAVERFPAGDRTRGFEGDRIFLGKNPPPGAALTYYLKSPAKDLKLVITDSAGTVVRTLSGDSVKNKMQAGINIVTWDLHVEPLPAPKGQPTTSGEGNDALAGPMVDPGTYKAMLIVDGKEVGTSSFAVEGDPEIQISDADRKAHFAALMTLQKLQGSANEAYGSVSALNDYVTALKKITKEKQDIPASIRSSVEELGKKVQPLLITFGVRRSPSGSRSQANVRQLISRLKENIMSSTSLPTETQMRQIAEVRADLVKAIGQANSVIASVPPVLKELADTKLYPVKAIPSAE